jgi:dsDNA-specific endonuclease/ATPase MutS2
MTARSRSVIKEVDLHLKEGYNRPDAVERQLARFRAELNGAARSGLREIIFIHGIGNGILKQELRKIIETDYKTCSYQDAPFDRYGFGGATLVTLKKTVSDGIR